MHVCVCVWVSLNLWTLVTSSGRVVFHTPSMDFVNHTATLIHNGSNVELLYGTDVFEWSMLVAILLCA